MIDIYTILGFVSGGGITAIVSTVISLKYAKKTPKLDYTERLGQFWESQNEKLLIRFNALEDRVKGLEEISCERLDCSMRITSIK